MKKKIFYSVVAVLFTVESLWAVPAKRTSMQFVQPDGSIVELCKTGDERSHLTLSPEGYPVAVDAQGYYCFADVDEAGALQPTAVRVKSLDKLSVSERATVEKIDIEKLPAVLSERRAASKIKNAPKISSRAGGGIGLIDDAFVGRSELKGLVILAQFKDLSFSSSCNRQFFVDMLNKEGFSQYGATGSARDYFIDSSTGQFTPQFDVYGPVTLPQNMSYYGGNDNYGDDKNAPVMIYDACKAADSQINFADYDLDGDGYVDNVFVYYAGYGEASYGSDDTVWPHQWELSAAGLTLKLDGVTIDKYACSNELEKDSQNKPTPDGVGTFVHEFSHVLGLPDLYDTSGSGEWTPSSWSVLDYGPYNNDGRTPPAYSVFERYALGWIEPKVLSGPDAVVLDAITESNEACIIKTKSENEFFLFENRQQQGWDKYLPGHGMLVWHIDYKPTVWQQNSVNNTSSHNYVDIEEACGAWYKSSQFSTWAAYTNALAGYAFPGTKNVTSFTDDTKPSMKTWSGTALSLPITDIRESDGYIYFNVAGGRCNADVPEVAAPKTIGNGWFEASWNAAAGAVGYELTVEDCGTGEAIDDEIANFGSGLIATLPSGWSFISSSGKTYTTSGNYGASKPSLKLENSGSGFTTAAYDCDIQSVSFWFKGQGTDASSYVAIDGLVGGTWKNIDKAYPTSNKAETYTLDEIPAGVRQLRITYNKSKGNLAIDDVVISFGKKNSTLAGFNALNVGNVTSYVVNVPENVENLIYKVRAIDDEGSKTAWSKEQHVSMSSDHSGVSDVAVDGQGSMTVDGRNIVWQGQPDVNVSLTDVCGRTVATAKTDSAGRAELSAPSSGIFILSAASTVNKIYLK